MLSAKNFCFLKLAVAVPVTGTGTGAVAANFLILDAGAGICRFSKSSAGADAC